MHPDDSPRPDAALRPDDPPRPDAALRPDDPPRPAAALRPDDPPRPAAALPADDAPSPQDAPRPHAPRPEDWHRTEDLDRFLDRAGDFLRSRPAAHTITLSVTETLRRRGLRAFGDEPPVFGTLERAGTVRATYLQTPPYWLNLTPLTPDEADSLADHLAGLGRPVPGVGGDRETAAAFAAAWQARTGATPTLHQRQRLYRLGTLTVPEPVPTGRARIAVASDRAQLAKWYGEFVEAVGEPGADTGAWADTRIAHGGVTLWETPDGTPVAMAGVTPQVAGQVRVAPVYTPARLRGRGYAGAVTAEVSRAARDAGADEVLLFTDLANPTSNALYQRIGYRPVTDFAVYDFPTDTATTDVTITDTATDVTITDTATGVTATDPTAAGNETD